MKRVLRSIVFTLLVIVITLVLTIFRDNIYHFYVKNIDLKRKNITINNNEYFNKSYLKNIKETNNFIAKDKEHLINIYFTIINSGNKKFTFYCDIDYDNCFNDLINLKDNNKELSIINNIVHPFYSYDEIEIYPYESGKVEIKIKSQYTQKEINEINKKVDEILKNELEKSDSNYDKVKKIHDYIINNTKNTQEENIKNNAYDVLINGLGKSSGYSDAMAIFLNRLNIPNYRIASEEHIWNYVYVNDKWLHLDLTLDDPITPSGEDLLKDYFFLIDEERLFYLDSLKHNYDKSLYKH